MYEANFEFNTNTIEFDSEINTKDIQANLVLNITPDRTSQLINDSDYTTNEALNNAVDVLDERIDVLDERIDNIVVDIEADLDLKADKTTVEALTETVSNNYNTLNTAIQNETEARIDADTQLKEELIEYVDENGGKIDVIQKNGTTLPIVNKTVNIPIPTDTSDLTNGAGYITNSALNGYATENWVEGKGYLTSADLSQIESDIEDIQELIPNQASVSNQLSDKNFVNSSIATNTAYFIGTFNSIAELEAYSGTLTNNDYAFVVGTDSAGNTVYDRYKYNADTQQWIFEYELNNSSFTAAQWAAINSGITTGDVSLIQTALQSGDNVSELVNDAGYITATEIANKQDKFTTGLNLAIDNTNTLNTTYYLPSTGITMTDGIYNLLDYIEPYEQNVYVDTAYILNEQDVLTVLFEIPEDVTEGGYLMGAAANGSTNRFDISFNPTEKRIGFNAGRILRTYVEGFNKVVVDFKEKRIYINSQLVGTLPSDYVPSSLNLYLFVLHSSSGGTSGWGRSRIKQLKIERGNQVIRNFVPLMKDNDDDSYSYYFHDTITNVEHSVYAKVNSSGVSAMQIAVDDKVLRNKSTQSTSIIEHKANIATNYDNGKDTIIGFGAHKSQQNGESTIYGYNAQGNGRSVAIGAEAKTSSDGVAIGYNTQAGWGVAVGFEAYTTGQNSIAIGYRAKNTAGLSDTIQIGTGTNTKSGTTQIRGWTLLDANGIIPKERLSSTTPSVNQIIRYNGSEVVWDDEQTETYVLPVATSTRLGGVKIGSGLSITNSGVLSATGGGGSKTSYDGGSASTVYLTSQLVDGGSASTVYTNSQYIDGGKANG